MVPVLKMMKVPSPQAFFVHAHYCPKITLYRSFSSVVKVLSGLPNQAKWNLPAHVHVPNMCWLYPSIQINMLPENNIYIYFFMFIQKINMHISGAIPNMPLAYNCCLFSWWTCINSLRKFYLIDYYWWMQELLQVHTPRLQREEAGAAAVQGRGCGGDNIWGHTHSPYWEVQRQLWAHTHPDADLLRHRWLRL